jgi:hypothetical protein
MAEAPWNVKQSKPFGGDYQDAGSNQKEARLNMAFFDLQRLNALINELNPLRQEISNNNWKALKSYHSCLRNLFTEMSGMLNEAKKQEYIKIFKLFDEDYALAEWNKDDSEYYNDSCKKIATTLENLDLKLVELKQALKMGMPTNESYTINDRVFKDLEVNRNIAKIILKRFQFDKKYEAEFKKWAEEDTKKKKIAQEIDKEFTEFDDNEAEE